MYSSWSKAVQVLSRSAEDTQLVADAAGGVREAGCRGQPDQGAAGQRGPGHRMGRARRQDPDPAVAAL
ncbi:hypothetical protein G6F31_021876 [Rhizopus arrhizus]|nr:hypothetical protein G6F31_021876 [Rhizopus arrhizus]